VLFNSFSTVRPNRIRVSRELSSDRIFENNEVEVKVTIGNRGKFEPFLEIMDAPPRQTYIVEGSNYFMCSLKKGEEVSFTYRLKCPLRGYFPFQSVEFRSNNIFSLFHTSHKLEVPTTISVFPAMTEIKDFRFKSNYPRISQGGMPQRLIGSGQEFYSIREYHPGDPFKNINWRAFARTRELMVNEHEREDLTDVVVLLDARGNTVMPGAKRNPLDYCTRVAASLSLYFIRRRDKMGITVYGDTIKNIHPDSGERHLYTILNLLAETRPKGELTLSSAIDVILPELNPRSPVILISTLHGDSTFPSTARRLVTRGFELIVITPQMQIFAEAAGDNSLSTSFSEIEKQNLMDELRSYGVRVIHWNPKLSLAAQLGGMTGVSS
jgi:uncharacterized protein (DUF58 family)